jgi:hypothetical protein
MSRIFTTRQIAELLGVELWRVQRIFEVGAVPEPDRFGGKRAVPSELVPQVVDALRDRDWLPEPVCEAQGAAQ